MRESDSLRGVGFVHATTEGRSIDRRLVQVKHSRSSIDTRCGIAGPAKTPAQHRRCADSIRRDAGRVRPWRAWKTKTHATDPMRLVYLPKAFAAADLVRSRLHGRPLVNRAT